MLYPVLHITACSRALRQRPRTSSVSVVTRQAGQGSAPQYALGPARPRCTCGAKFRACKDRKDS